MRQKEKRRRARAELTRRVADANRAASAVAWMRPSGAYLCSSCYLRAGLPEGHALVPGWVGAYSTRPNGHSVRCAECNTFLVYLSPDLDDVEPMRPERAT